MRVLVVNVGSSTIKLRLVEEAKELVASVEVETSDDASLGPALEAAVERSGLPDAVGHRIVHGGTTFRKPTVLADPVIDELKGLAPLAPLHQERGLSGVALMARFLPDVPAVGCFDTSFFADLPVAARTYALPQPWRERFGLTRFGFHGLSHSYAAAEAARLLGDGARRVVTCHLGSGGSLAAVRDGRPVDTTMGFTPLEGIVMATRSGTIDPGIILWLQSEAGLDHTEISDGLEHGSGLRGLAGTSDMREVLASAGAGDEDAQLALDVYAHRLRGAIAAMAAAMDGLDALVFTGGIGENAAEIRRLACAGLTHLGIRIDDGSARGNGRVDIDGSNVAVLVIPAREDLAIARQVEDVLSG